jgi:hypothetical protein
MISLLRAPIAPGLSNLHVRGPFDPRVHSKEVAVDYTRSERIAKAEEGLVEMQTVLEHAKRAVEAADRVERAAQQGPSTLVRSRKRRGRRRASSGRGADRSRYQATSLSRSAR